MVSCLQLTPVVIALTFVTLGYSATVTIDVDADVASPWDNQCVSGYHHMETFSCDQGPLIPADQHTGNQGYWARCSVFFVPRCDLFYRPPSGGPAWKVISVVAYFQGSAAIEVVVEHGNGFLTRLLQGARGWQTVSVDISNLAGISEIKVTPEFQGVSSFTVIDKITLDDAVPVPTTTTTTTTTPPPTPEPTTEDLTTVTTAAP